VRRKIALLLASAVAVLAGFTGGFVAAVASRAEPAQAHTQWTCAHGTACLFRDFNGGPAGGSHLTFYFSVWVTPEDPPGTCHNLPSTWYDIASSVVSDYGSGYDFAVYENANCTDLWGFDRFTSPTHNNFSGSYAHLNNDVQSFKIIQ
jgi:hypothetical protein